MFKRLQLLRRLQEVDIESPEAAMALLERVKTHTSRPEDRACLAQLIRVTIDVTDQMRAEPDGQTPPGSKRPSSPKPNANVNCPKPPGAAIGRSDLEVKDSMWKQPAAPVTLSAEEGAGLIAHGHQRNLPAAVAGRLEQSSRTCFWLGFALQETQMTVKRLRRLLCGKGLKPLPTPADASAPSPADREATPAGAVCEADGADADAPAGEACDSDEPA